MNMVECHSDTEYAETPLALTWEGYKYEIAEIVARWLDPVATAEFVQRAVAALRRTAG